MNTLQLQLSPFPSPLAGLDVSISGLDSWRFTSTDMIRPPAGVFLTGSIRPLYVTPPLQGLYGPVLRHNAGDPFTDPPTEPVGSWMPSTWHSLVLTETEMFSCVGALLRKGKRNP